MLFVELWYVPSKIDQAEDRIWRVGQVNDVTINYLLIPSNNPEYFSVDTRLKEILEKKRLLIAEVMGLEKVGESTNRLESTGVDDELRSVIYEVLQDEIAEDQIS